VFLVDNRGHLMTEELSAENAKLKIEIKKLSRQLNLANDNMRRFKNAVSAKENISAVVSAEKTRQEKQLQVIMDNSLDIIILLDSDMNIVLATHNFLKMANVESLVYLRNKTFSQVFSSFTDDVWIKNVEEASKKAFNTNEIQSFDTEIRINDETSYYAMGIIPFFYNNDGESGLFIHLNNITERMDMANELKVALSNATRANKAKSDFLAVMSHELRTPLNAVLGISQVHLRDKSLHSNLVSSFSQINSSGTQLLCIINDLLDLSRIETGKFELNPAEYDLPSLINDSIMLNIVRIGSKAINFNLDINDNLPLKLFGDELRLKQLLNNLLSNAIKYTEEGYVKLSVSFEKDGGDGLLSFTVADTGQGIKSSDQIWLFDEYIRFNNSENHSTEGAGLGLTIVKNLVSLMDGTINVESEYGQGSVFTITVRQKLIEGMPIGQEIAESLRSFNYKSMANFKNIDIDYEPIPHGSVLIVDDVEINLLVAEAMLEPYELNVEMVSNGIKAINKIKSGNVYDIIFMDHMMPVMDGIEATKKLRELGYTGAIVALTANALVGNADMFKQSGFDDFVSKPIDASMLATVINKFIRRR